MTTPVEVYKSEFLKNANLTHFSGVLDNTNLLQKNTSNTAITVNFLSDNILYISSLDLLNLNLKNLKTNFLESGKTQTFKKDLLFVSGVDEKIFKQTPFKKSQLLNSKKNKPTL